MWYGLDKTQQIFLRIAGLLLFAIFLVIIILAIGSFGEHQPDISGILVVLFVLPAVVTLIIIINRIHTCSRSMDQKKELAKNRKQSGSSIRIWMKSGRVFNG